MVDKKIGDYTYNKFIGEGSFGKVYKGKNNTTGEEVAVKVMEMKNLKDPFLLESLRNEIKVMKQLTSPNVVRMYDVIQDAKATYIILEYCPDGDLSKFIRNVKLVFFYPFFNLENHVMVVLNCQNYLKLLSFY